MLVLVVPVLLVGTIAATPYSVSILSGNSMQPEATPCDLMLVDTTQTSLDDFEEGDWLWFEIQVVIPSCMRYMR